MGIREACEIPEQKQNKTKQNIGLKIGEIGIKSVV